MEIGMTAKKKIPTLFKIDTFYKLNRCKSLQIFNKNANTCKTRYICILKNDNDVIVAKVNTRWKFFRVLCIYM